SAVLFLAYAIMARYGLPQLYKFMVLLAIVFVTPLPLLIFTGEEHILHAYLTIAFIFLASRVLSSDHLQKGQSLSSAEKRLLVIAPLLTMARYEGLFLAFVTCLLLFARRRFAYSVVLGVAAILPAAVYAVISAAEGAFIIPNSVLLKG